MVSAQNEKPIEIEDSGVVADGGASEYGFLVAINSCPRRGNAADQMVMITVTKFLSG